MVIGHHLLTISIHALREEGDQWKGCTHSVQRISIHALREEGDHTSGSATKKAKKFLSTPSARRATVSFMPRKSCLEFLSTPSARRATEDPAIPATMIFISIHALREEGDVHHGQRAGRQKISIHALREEGDIITVSVVTALFDFYPRPPRGGRRTTSGFKSTTSLISIHALREEGDRKAAAGMPFVDVDFYPRPPRGGRPGGPPSAVNLCQFLSTPSARRATARSALCTTSGPISIHALREEGDS